MPDVAKLKKKAAEFELKKQFDKALAAYVEILDSYEKHEDEEVDLALYNRVGDLYLKQGNVAEAVDYYEQAVDRYAEGGFFNNAIALCNKILRNSPGRASVYYKLGKISAHKGFKGDAKANFLEYADRMQQAGKIDESFRALKEFADLCPDQDDIRLMLAEQLSRKGRGPEAIEQLQTLFERYTQEGREGEARATVDRMKAIDPSIEPRGATNDAKRPAAGDLVFLDLEDTTPAAPRPTPRPAPAPPPPPPPATPALDQKAKRATAGLEIIATGDHPDDLTIAPAPPSAPARATAPAPAESPAARPPRPSQPWARKPAEPAAPAASGQAAPSQPDVELELYQPEVLDGMNRGVDFDRGADPGNSAGLLDGLQPTSFEASDAASSGSLLDFEPTSFDGGSAADVPSLLAPEPPAMPAAEPVVDLDFGDDARSALDADQRERGPREVAPREVLRDADATARSPLHDLPMLDDGGADDEGATSSGGDLELIMPEDDAAPAAAGPGPLDDIPLMDLDLPVPGEASAHIAGAPVTPAAEAELEMLDLEMPGFEAPAAPAPRRAEAFASPAFELAAPEAELEPAPPAFAEPVAELTPAELDVRAELELDAAPVADEAPADLAPVGHQREPTGEFDTIPDAPAASVTFNDIPAPPRRSSTLMAVQSVEMLQALVDADPDDNALRRRFGEAMLEKGDREGGMRELEAAMVGYERADDLSSAASLADEIVLLNPSSVRHHQKRVEYAFRTNERGRLIEAYLQLADALFRAEQLEKSRAIYQRVLDLAPDDVRALTALQSFPEVAAPPAPAPPTPAKGRASVAMPRPAAPLKPLVTDDDEFVNLGDWLRDDEAPKDTRMVVEEKEPTGDEEADFQDMLRKFKQGIAENVEEEDHQSHYDLGVAYKEMGLLDEAIAEFQKALRGPVNRVPTYEALGQCFIEKEQYPMAATILGRALQEKGMSDDQLVGVLYLLGLCAEQRGQKEQAAQYYQRVFVVDIQFRDVGDRLAAVEAS